MPERAHKNLLGVSRVDHEHHTRLQSNLNRIREVIQQDEIIAQATLPSPSSHIDLPTDTMAANYTNSTVNLMDTDRFNGVNGIGVNEYIANIEAQVRADSKVKAEDFGKTCVILARTRLNTTLSIDLKNIAMAIDTRPEETKTWEWVRSMLISGFGTDDSDPYTIFTALLELRPNSSNAKSITSFIALVHHHIRRWHTNVTGDSNKPFTSGTDEDKQIRFWTIGLLGTCFPKDIRTQVLTKLRTTKPDLLATKMTELLRAHDITLGDTTHITMATTIPNTYSHTPKHDTSMQLSDNIIQHPANNTSSFSPRNNGNYRGTTRGRGNSNIRRTLYNRQNTQVNRTYDQGPIDRQEIRNIWPKPNQCMNCLAFGHRMRECNGKSFCAYHKCEGHHLLQCYVFRNTTGIQANTRGNFYIELTDGGGTLELKHRDVEL